MPFEKDADGNIVLEVNGAKVALSEDEVLKRAQQVESATRKWQEAADERERLKAQRDELTPFMQMKDDMALVQNIEKDPAKAAEAFKRLAKQFGADDAEADAVVQKLSGRGPTNSTSGTATIPVKGMDVVPIQQLPPQLRGLLNALDQAGVSPELFVQHVQQNIETSSRGRASEIIRSAIDNHSEFGKIVKSLGSGPAKAIQKTVEAEVERRLRAGEKATPDTISKAINEVKGLVDVLVEASRPRQPDMPDFRKPWNVAPTGLDALASGVYPPAEPDPTKMSDKDYIDAKLRYDFLVTERAEQP